MTVEELIPKGVDDYRIIIVPNTGKNSHFSTWETSHPVSGKPTVFVIQKDANAVAENLYIMDKMEWNNLTVKNQKTTVDGKPFRCLFVTKEESDDALVLGQSPEIYVLSMFSPVYFLLAYFKPQLLKNLGDEGKGNRRLVSYEDLIDSISESDLPISKLVTEFKFELKIWIEKICEHVVVPGMDSDDDEKQGTTFFRPSLDLITTFINDKFTKIIELSSVGTRLKTLKLRMQSTYTGEISPDLSEMLWRKQAMKFMSLFVDAWFITETEKAFKYDFGKLDLFIADSKKKLDEQTVLQESLESMHGNFVSAAKKGNTKKVAKTIKKNSVKVKSGALDMFFRKKEN